MSQNYQFQQSLYNPNFVQGIPVQSQASGYQSQYSGQPALHMGQSYSSVFSQQFPQGQQLQQQQTQQAPGQQNQQTPGQPNNQEPTNKAETQKMAIPNQLNYQEKKQFQVNQKCQDNYVKQKELYNSNCIQIYNNKISNLSDIFAHCFPIDIFENPEQVEEFKCQINNGILNNPVIDENGYLCCQNCYLEKFPYQSPQQQQIIQGQNQVPQNQQAQLHPQQQQKVLPPQIQQKKVPIQLKNYLNKQKVKCFFAKNGKCNWQGTLETLFYHLKNDCFQKCQICDEIIPKIYFSKHLIDKVENHYNIYLNKMNIDNPSIYNFNMKDIQTSIDQMQPSQNNVNFFQQENQQNENLLDNENAQNLQNEE